MSSGAKRSLNAIRNREATASPNGSTPLHSSRFCFSMPRAVSIFSRLASQLRHSSTSAGGIFGSGIGSGAAS